MKSRCRVCFTEIADGKAYCSKVCKDLRDEAVKAVGKFASELKKGK